MELRYLKYFIAVAKEFFPRAASRLRTAQPFISRQVSRREDELGPKLFKRNSRRSVRFLGLMSR